jgi:pilus assembly protein FimV
MLPLVPDSPEAAREALALAEPMIGWQDATVALPEAGAKMPGTAAKLPAEPSVQQAAATPRVETRLDYNLVDLDMTVQHVHLPSALNENTVVKERRTNLADVLKLAIEREPNRNDLRMKLLELYFSQATTNRDGFLEVVQKLAEDRDYRQSADWEKIASMGRQIAADNPLFIDELVTEDDLSIERKSA